jgi:polysaccharide deacetylase family protein (PEP-CTERM system associated)
MPAVVNAMTVDVEDYFQVSAFESHIARSSWETLPRRIEGNVARILEIFDEFGIKGTFFTLGWIAERHPQLIRDIVREGHELASHGWSHVRVTKLTEAEFREDVSRTKQLLEDLSGAAVLGYRAPSYSIGRDNLWALRALEEEGHWYSSSIYPIQHDLYGMPEAPRFAFRPGNCTTLLEIPVTTVHAFGRRWPCGGGGYFRLVPYSVFRWGLRRVNRARQAGIFYFHPWELDPGQPVQPDIGVKTRFRHYLNLRRVEGRLRRLLGEFRWDRVDRIFLNPEAGART